MNVIITGASSGIGNEMAKQFAEKGHRVLAIARSKEKLEQLAEINGLITTLVLDLSFNTGEDDFRQSIEEWEEVDVVINNAGQLINKPFMETPINDFESMFNINVLSAIRIVQWSYDKLKKSEHAHIINISSMGGFQGSSKFSGLSAYSVSKGAVSILTECLAAEFAETSIKVNALALGAVGTEMLNNAFPGYEAPVSSSHMAKYIVDFAISGSQYYNGKILPVALGNP